ncbi:aldehyde dehydrogenase [Cohnella kolymensis]|uniref:Aldehyde dehydrogenase n=1 Tax=Cohnella kolymensis TaxID=1590652 RepID=A0ABR5A8I6_9BACL|nr:aldehyde dehydrogenase [Cohnella kolymensis]
MLINNQDVPTDSYAEVRDPGRLTDVVGEVAQGTAQHVEQAVQAAHQAYQTWHKTDLTERSELLLKAASLLEAEASTFAPLIARESGMIPSVTLAEIGGAVAGIRHTVEAAKVFFEEKQFEDEHSWVSVEKRPIGVIVGIVPWNAPVILTMQKLAPALVCGNTIVFKPSPNAPLGISSILMKIAELFPPGVINVVHGGGDVGSALTAHPLVRKISFTGGGTVAKYVMQDAANSLKNVHFELGGNDPAIVLDDADMQEVLPKIVTSVFRRSGQYCYATKRVYVPQNMYEKFFDEMCQIVDQYQIGHQMDPKVTFGPLNNKVQFNYVNELIERTKQSGAQTVILGEKVEPDNWDNGYYLQPVIVKNPHPNQEIVTCEQFGPIIPLIPYSTEEEVLQMANSTDYGLGSTIWSSDFDRAVRLSRQIEAGMTFINQNGQSRLGLRHIPFGGVKQSGIGRENSEIGLAEYIEYHSINYHK